MGDDIHFSSVLTNGMRLHVAQAGPANAPLVILLHGFPEFWYGWRQQIPALAAAGFRVWAPDQRGYGGSDKPARVSDYTLDKLTSDVAGLIATAGQQQAFIVGHDWGGIVGWWLAATRPNLVRRLVILNVPHPQVLRRMVLLNPLQTMRSWYAFAFQIPWLPEWLARRREWQSLIRSLQRTSRPGTFTANDFEHYREAWSQPGAFNGMLNWYRAAFRYGLPRTATTRILPPTLILWGKQDQFIRLEAAQASLDLCDQGQVVVYEAATHWLQHEEPDDVNRRIVDFLR